MIMKKKSKYLFKLDKNISPILDNIENPKILELGVRHGISTNFFLEYCEKNNGKLYSVDIDDCSNVSKSDKWKFIHSSDDEYDKIIKETGSNFDLIYIDSFHNANHVCKIIYLYFMDLKKNGHIFVDDISWILYSKKNNRDNFNSEINNYETFLEILNILNTNMDSLLINFDFTSSGLCKIEKITDQNLNKRKKIISRSLTIKNMVRKILLK
jgi:hypothetical protein